MSGSAQVKKDGCSRNMGAWRSKAATPVPSRGPQRRKHPAGRSMTLRPGASRCGIRSPGSRATGCVWRFTSSFAASGEDLVSPNELRFPTHAELTRPSKPPKPADRLSSCGYTPTLGHRPAHRRLLAAPWLRSASSPQMNQSREGLRARRI